MRLLLIAAGCLFTSAAAADADEAVCAKKAEFAAATMEVRQAGIPLARLLDTIGDEDTPDDLEAEMKMFAVEAYKENAWRTEEAQQRAITEFSNKVMVECLEAS